jgi:hypothetical protein
LTLQVGDVTKTVSVEEAVATYPARQIQRALKLLF